ncbi:MAG: aldo/keto reductase [Sarcina sp.]|nr:aldo/keto reductase [Sarcina sp.]
MEHKEAVRVPFGKTGLSVSPLTFGAWGIGGAGWDDYPDDVRLDAITAAVEAGINLIDTAPAYNAGKSEQYIGRALEETSLRKDVLITTKTGNDFIDGQYIRNGKADNIYALCERSLKNLRTDYIDILLLHWPDPNVPLEETMNAMQRLREEKVVRHLGVCNISRQEMELAMQFTDLEVYQAHYSLLMQDHTETISWAHDQQMGIMAYGTLCGGLLTGRYREQKNYEKMDNRNRFYGRFFQEPAFSRAMELLDDTIQPIADAHEAALAEVAINWSRQQPFVDTCLVGAQKRSRVEANARSLDWTLTDDEMAKLNAWKM